MTTGETHEAICRLIGIPSTEPRPMWLPYAAQATRITVYHEIGGPHRIVYGGAMLCARCGFHVDQLPEPTDPAAISCPKCGYTGK